MKPRACLIFAASCMCCLVHDHLAAQPVAAQPNYRFQHFDTNDGLPSKWAWSIAQDSLGFIWIQYYGGLSRYDGYSFKVYKHDVKDTVNSLPGGIIGKIVADHSGNIWVTEHHQTQTLTKYDRKTDRFIKYEPDLKGASVNGFRFDKTSPTIWFATNGNGLFSFNSETLETNNYLNNHPDPLIKTTSNFIWDISDRDSCILVASSKGLWKFDKKDKVFSRPDCNPADSALLYHTAISNIDDGPTYDYNNVWLHSHGKLLKVDKNLSVIQHFDFPIGFGFSGYERDKEGIFWIATVSNGLYRYDPRDKSFINIKNIPGDVNSLKSNNLNGVKVDKDQNIWITSAHGVSQLQKQSLRFYNFTLSDGRIDLSTVYHTANKDFVIISKVKNDTEILISPVIPGRLDSLRFETLTVIKKNPLTTTIPGLSTAGLWKGKHNFWISSYGQGIARMSIDPASGMIIAGKHEMLTHDPGNPNTISSNSTTFVWEDTQENVWVGTRGSGLNKINPRVPYGSEGSVVQYRSSDQNPTSLSNNFVWHFYPENEKAFWITTETGIDLFSNERFEHVLEYKNSPTSIYKAPDSTLFIGGVGGLLEGNKRGNQYEFSQNPLFKNEDVVRVQQDRLGRLWLFNTKGAVCYDRNERVMVEFNEKDGLDHTRAITTWYRETQTSTGIIVISDHNGLSLFNPLSLRINHAAVAPLLTRLTVNNNPPVVGGSASTKNFSIKTDISILNELILDYQHNNFSLEFSAMEMTAPEKNRYRHKLQGYDKDWIETDWKNRLATYTNLNAGNYIFKVRASNHHGIWSEQETSLIIRILPPPWKTWWAYGLYGLALMSILLYWRRYENNRLKLKHRAAYLGELDNLKTRFFANISHEFRTPISLILGPLKEMCTGTFRGDPKPAMETMMRNGQRLLRLINQLLDLSKVEAGKMHLHASAIDLVEFLREIASSYESLATEKKIKYVFYPEAEELIAHIDPEKMEKVVHNLLSNAFKFTKPGGEVILNLKAEKNNCLITVKDTGIGIPDNQLNKVFDRFYQVDSSQTRAYEGSGLGMALAKELVELHKGKISVSSIEGKGTTFTVLIPLGKEHLNKDEINDSVYHSEAEKLSDIVVSAGPDSEVNEPASSTLQSMLLIVEDNADMRRYIRKTLAEHYQILEAENGKAGVKLAEETIPDLIISDIMMPEMDGYKLCEIIKTNELTCHIPVILLTAKADRESKLAGLQFGADDYLSKPFDADELKLIVRNRIEERRKMRERFSREITLEPKQISINSLDEKFLTKVLAIIEAHLDDENFSIEELSREAGFSNMHFYRKIKGLSGQTPSQFLRTIRLKRAAELLAKDSDNVTQIAYSVGFSSLSYFNKCFKEQFGVTPGQYGEKNLNIKK